jgi:mRNA interferase MazF
MTLRKGDICLVNLSGGVGHEQFGSRPAVVLATTDTNIIIVIPVTANTEALRFSHTLLLPTTKQNGLLRESVALLFHVRAVDTRRVERMCGSLDAATRRVVDKGLRRLFDV